MGNKLTLSYLTQHDSGINSESSDASDDEFHSLSSTPVETDMMDNQKHSTGFTEMDLKRKVLDYQKQSTSIGFTEMDFKKKLDNINRDLNTDAIGSENLAAIDSRQMPKSSKITVETVHDIEKELSFYEKVSLVFLLYDHVDVALEWIVKESSNLIQLDISANLLYEWARQASKSSAGNIWQKQFLEALCIIQNYSILRRLGYDVKEVKSRFLPSSPYTSLHINLQRKALYYICENLGINQTRVFINHLKNAFREKSLHFEDFDEKYLEIYLLHCFSMKFITKNNFTNLINIFKKMSMPEMSELLTRMTKENEVSITTDETKCERTSRLHFELNTKVTNISGTTRTCSDNSVISDTSITSTRSFFPENECYNIDPENVGICLIINQKHFYKSLDPNIATFRIATQNLENREGTDHDRDRLKNTFSKLGFEVIMKDDRTHVEMIQDIKDTLKKISDKDSCFVLSILTHGQADIVYGTDSVQVYVSDIENLLYEPKYSKLLGKPKILIIQSCQGMLLQKALSHESDFNETDGISPPKKENTGPAKSLSERIPQRSDLLICWSTLPGFASVRNKRSGSWFIQELCNTIDSENERTHFADMLISVTNKVSDTIWEKDGNNLCMVPKHESTFRKRLYLPTVSRNAQNATK